MEYCNNCGEYFSDGCSFCGMENKISQLEKENTALKAEIDKRDALLEKAKLLIESYKLILKAFDGPDAILALYCSDNCEKNIALIKSKCDEFLKELTQGSNSGD